MFVVCAAFFLSWCLLLQMFACYTICSWFLFVLACSLGLHLAYASMCIGLFCIL